MKNNVFDNMTKLPVSVRNIDYADIGDNSIIDTDSIKNRVFSSGEFKRKKIRPVRKFIMIAVAVIICICIFSLPVVAENLYVLYGSVIGGDSYTGDFENIKNADVSFHDPDLKLDSLKVSSYDGISGLIDIRVSKKSGKKFSDSTFNIIKNGNFSAWLSDENDPEPGGNHQLEMIIGNSEDHRINGLGYNALYGLENDGRVIHIIISVNLLASDANGNDSFGKSLHGREITIKSYNYLMASVDSVLGSFDEINESNMTKINDLQNNVNTPLPYDIFTNSYYYSDVVYNNNSFDVVKGRGKLFSLPFEISFKLNNEVTEKSNIADDSIFDKVFNCHTKNGRFCVSPSGILLYAETDNQIELPDMSEWYIKTKDGSKYYICADSCSSSEGSVNMTCNYKKFPNNSKENFYDKKLYLIAPDNISEICLNGSVITE